ncbi:MAG: hypothetical protein WD342_09720 [Verrucomicrobiales bacterium]
MKKLRYFLLIAISALVPLVSAQEPQPPDDPADPAAETEAAPPGLVPPDDDEADTSDIDFLKRSNLLIAKIQENDRPVDPFGMKMDPANTREPLLADQYNEVEEAPVLTNSSLKDALQTLPITGVYPKQEKIVLGARSFSAGDQFGMKLKEMTIRLRLEKIRGTEIYFQDMDTREVATVDFDATPKEFEPITRSSQRPLGGGIEPMDDLFIIN